MTPPEYRSHRLHHDKLPRDFSAGEKPGLGQGRQLSESVRDHGLKTPVYEYLPGDRRVEVTYVEGLVVRFTISSR